MDLTTRLIERIESRDARVGVIGLGYVGLALAVEFGRGGFQVIGVDTDARKVGELRAGRSYVMDVDSKDVAGLIESGRLNATTDYAALKEADAVSIAVPTPLRKSKDPDISCIVAAVEGLRPYIRPGMLVVLESTTYPGTTREQLANVFEGQGLKPGKDIFIAFSPERVDPGNPVYKTRNTPKVIGGLTPECTRVASALYGKVIETVVNVSSLEEAEMVKLLENTFRAVNIGLVNELMLMCDRMGINIWHVIEAAKTKPFGFMPFYPGPGIGGHCIPLDPMYLAWRAKSYDFYNRFIELATDINGNMPRFVAQKLARLLNRFKKPVNGSRILLLGMAYKSDTEDTRESPAVELLRILKQDGAEVAWYDPYVDSLPEANGAMRVERLDREVVASFDAAVLATQHHKVDLSIVLKHAQVILDCRNGFPEAPNVVKL